MFTSFLRCQALFFFFTDGLRLLVKRPGLAHVRRFWLALRMMSTLEICSTPRMFVSVSSRLLVFIAVASRQCPRSLARILSALTFRILRISHMNHVGQCIRVGAGASGSTRWRGTKFARTVCLSCSHLRIDVQGTSAVAFCSSLQLVVAGVAAWTCQCACARSEFQHRQSALNSLSHERAGSCSRHGAAKICQRGPK